MLLPKRAGVTLSVRWLDPAGSYLLPKEESSPIPRGVEQVAGSFTLPEQLTSCIFLAVSEDDPSGRNTLLILTFDRSSQVLGRWCTADALKMGSIALRLNIVTCLGERSREILGEKPFDLEDLSGYAAQLRRQKLAREILMYLF